MGKFSNIVILCIGTSKLMGDSIGPIVGQKLTRLLKNKQNIRVYGNREYNLTLKNAKQVLQEITDRYTETFVITIDAALGPKEMIESIWVTRGSIKIGEALGQGIQYFSDINIKGIVGENQKNIKENFNALNKASRKSIHRLSNQITYQVCQIIEEINYV